MCTKIKIERGDEDTKSNKERQREAMKSKSFKKRFCRPKTLFTAKIKNPVTPLSSQKPKNQNHLLPSKSKSKT